MVRANCLDKERTLIVFEVPSVGSPAFIEMYLNPQNIEKTEAKLIQKVRTKGGFIIQYWGEELPTIKIQGHTGDGGIEAINVLNDIYKSEQRALAKLISSEGSNIKRRQSLAQMAASVIMWYQGQGHRGFFTNFHYAESTQEMGLFNYDMSFTVVETIGERKNFLPWHRKPWSTQDNPSVADGQGSTTGGAYNTNTKLGELNAPEINSKTGILGDTKFSSRTGAVILPGGGEHEKLQENLEDNNPPLAPSSLFANV